MTIPTAIRSARCDESTLAAAIVRRSIIECCTPDHGHDLVKLRSWLRNKTSANFHHWIAASEGYAWMACCQSQPVGFGLMSRSGKVLLCYLLPCARYIGIGKALLQAMEVQALDAGMTELVLDSTQTARIFYLRNGFEPVSECSGSDAEVVMKKALHGVPR